MDLSKIRWQDVPFFSFNGTRTKAKVVRVLDGDTVHLVIPFHQKPAKM